MEGKALSINEEKIAEEEELYDGYYAIVTSEKELSNRNSLPANSGSA